MDFKPGINTLAFSEDEKLPEGAVRLNKNQIWLPKNLPRYNCPNCKQKTAVREPGIEKLHCPECSWWETDPSFPVNKKPSHKKESEK